MKIREILNMKSEELEKIMTEEDYEKMNTLNINTLQLLDMLQDSARQSNQDEDEEHITISAYLDYLEEMRNSENEI